MKKKQLKLFCTSDTHCRHRKLHKYLPKPDEYDVLVITGDYSGRGSLEDTKQFCDWLKEMQEIFPYIVFIPGNHDFIFENNEELAKSMLPEGVIYLHDSSVEIEGFKFWGSPWTPWFHSWAFNAERGEEIKKHWDGCPDDTDVMLTHGPPYDIGDDVGVAHKNPQGCQDLREAILDRIKPIVHICGHIHEGYGEREEQGIKFLNASFCDEFYHPINEPLKITITKEEKEDESRTRTTETEK